MSSFVIYQYRCHAQVMNKSHSTASPVIIYLLTLLTSIRFHLADVDI